MDLFITDLTDSELLGVWGSLCLFPRNDPPALIAGIKRELQNRGFWPLNYRKGVRI